MVESWLAGKLGICDSPLTAPWVALWAMAAFWESVIPVKLARAAAGPALIAFTYPAIPEGATTPLSALTAPVVTAWDMEEICVVLSEVIVESPDTAPWVAV